MADYGRKPTNLGGEENPLARQLTELDSKARGEIEREDFHAAVLTWTQSLKIAQDPADVARILISRAYTLRQIGDDKTAAADLSAVIKLRGAPAEEVCNAFVRRADIKESAGDLPAAIADISAALQLYGVSESTKASTLIDRAIMHSKLHNQKQALADYAAVLEMPAASRSQKAKARRNRATFYSKHGQPELSIADYLAVIEMPESDADLKAACWNGLAWVRYEMNDFAGCEEAAKKSLAENPGHLLARFNLGLAMLEQQKNVEEAIGHYKRGAAESVSKEQLQHDSLDDLQAIAKKRPGLAGVAEATAIVEARMAELPA